MEDLDLLHFEQLKTEIQDRYLEHHHPSDEKIANWKGIDIIYFQEDLRKVTKANISEKSFYTYFKTSPVTKLPRIDILNLLSIYAGYQSWFEFKKNHPFANEILQNLNESEEIIEENKTEELPEEETDNIFPKNVEKEPIIAPKEYDLQENVSDNELNKVKNNQQTIPPTKRSLKTRIGEKIWYWMTGILALGVAYLGFGDQIFDTTYSYRFVDADRNAPIQTNLEIKLLKNNESPLFFRLKPNEVFYYPTKDKTLQMEVSSPIYENMQIVRNLEDAPKEEIIQLKPDDYKMAVYYFSKKDISENTEQALSQIKQKRIELENRISNKAVIYQVFDNDIYGVETLDKQKYINLVTTPTTSLKNLSVIEMKRDQGKIVSIKFKINDNDN